MGAKRCRRDRHWAWQRFCLLVISCCALLFAPLGASGATTEVLGSDLPQESEAYAEELSGRADELAQRGEFPTARAPAEQALALRLRLHGELHLATAAARQALGTVLQAIDDVDGAIEQFESALKTREQLLGPSAAEVGVTLTALGWSRLSQSRYTVALDLYRRALSILERARGPEHADVARVLNDLGVLHEQVGQHDVALPYQQQALALREQLLGPDAAPVAQALNNLAGLYEAMGQYERAVPLYERALDINRRTLGPEHPEVASVLQNFALLRHRMGEDEKALPLLEQALALDQRAFGENHAHVAFDLEGIAAIHRSLGSFDRALDYQTRAREILRTRLGAGHRRIATNLNNSASLLAALGRREEARALYQQSLEIKRSAPTPDEGSIAVTLTGLGSIAKLAGNLSGAAAHYDEALAAMERAHGPMHPRVADVLVHDGGLRSLRGDSQSALPKLHRAEWIATAAGATPELWRAQAELHDAYRRVENKGLAVMWGKRAVNTIQALRGRLAGLDPLLQRNFLADKRRVYVSLADTLVSLGRVAEAQDVLAMLKEEELHDFTARDAAQDPRVRRVEFLGPAETSTQRRWDSVVAEFMAASRAAADLRRRQALGLSLVDQARLTQLEEEAAVANRRFEAFLQALSQEFAAASASPSEGRVERRAHNLQLMQAQLAALGRGTVLLHYLVADKRVVIIMTTATTQAAREAQVQSTEMNRKVLAFREALAAKRDVTALAVELHELLIGPIRSDLERTNAETLMLSLDGSLRYVPFAALHDGHQWLAQRYRIALFAEAAGEQAWRAPRAQWTMTGLGVTRALPGFRALPAVREELEGVRRHARGGDIFLDEQFTAQRLHAALAAEAPVLHVASHFQFRPGSYADSFLLLGDGGRFSLKEMRDRRLRFAGLDLLTLSACDTAMGGGADETGAEIESFGALAQRQGAAGVVATLWPVADGSTSLFMQTLYGQRQASGGTSKAEALRLAQGAFLSGRLPDGRRIERRYAHPHYWAPYVLMGNWR